MSNSTTEPTGSAPPRRPRPSGLVIVLAVVLPVLLLLALALPLGIAWAVGRRQAPVLPSASSSPTQGSRGLGDPYYPDAGNGGYDAQRYAIDVAFDPGSATLSGTTTIEARSTQTLRSFYLDFALDVSAVTVDGRDATFTREGFSDLRVTPPRAVRAGDDFTVAVTYAGQPTQVQQDGASAWRTSGQEWTIANEPEASAWWYPANDHPSDPALMDVRVRVPRGMEAVSVGRLVEHDTTSDPGFETWHWAASQPMATFLNFLTIGQYELRQGTVDGLAYVYAVSEQLDPAQRQQAFGVLERSDDVVRVLAGLFGPYPFTELGGVVPGGKLGFGGLENQTRPVYNAEYLLTPGYADELLAHELAHMWFGDNVTVREWNDIFNSEAYASWAAWAWREQTGGVPAQQSLTRTYDRAVKQPEFWRVTMIDPGRDNLFSTVYQRGPMALQALRNVMGEGPFSQLNRQWAQLAGTRSVEDWMAAAQALTPTDLGPFFQAWIYAPRAPARTAANGLG